MGACLRCSIGTLEPMQRADISGQLLLKNDSDTLCAAQQRA